MAKIACWHPGNDRSLQGAGFRILALAFVLSGSACEVFAALGKAPSPPPLVASTNPAPVVRRLAAAAVPRSDLYTVHEAQLETGTRVLEYSNAAGIVFALVWRGPVLPDLSELLGDHFTTFSAEMAHSRALGIRGSPATVARDALVLRSSGRMRNFSGYAYSPALVPAGVDIHDVLQ